MISVFYSMCLIDICVYKTRFSCFRFIFNILFSYVESVRGLIVKSLKTELFTIKKRHKIKLTRIFSGLVDRKNAVISTISRFFVFEFFKMKLVLITLKS